MTSVASPPQVSGSPTAAGTGAPAQPPALPKGMDPAYYALSLLRRRKLDECVAVSAYYLQHGTSSRSQGPGASTDATNGSGNQTLGGVDEQLWYIQTKAMVLQSWFDDTEIEDDGVDDVLLEGEQAVTSTAHRPSTSLNAARTGRQTAGRGGAGQQAPGSRAGGLSTSGNRPVSSRYGFARPGTLNNRPGTQSGRGGTAARPVTGRFVRLGTASLMAVPGGPHINLQRLNLEKYAREKPMIAKLLCDYLLYVEHRPKMALELCTAALKQTSAAAAAASSPPPTSSTAAPPGLPLAPGLPPKLPMGASGAGSAPVPRPVVQVGIANGNDWWWKERLGKASYQLGLLREAEKHFKAALFERPVDAVGTVAASTAALLRGTVLDSRRARYANYHTSTLMELGKVYNKMDQPLTALELFMNALEENPVDHHVLLCCARLYDELHESEKAFEAYSQVLRVDSSNVEAIACIGAYFFYEKNQPEQALRYYRRLLFMGLRSTEVWNNVGLCTFYTSQFDIALNCFERALLECRDDAQRADVWYNVGHVGLGLGDLKFAERAFKLAVAADGTHAEAINNLAVLALETQEKAAKAGKHLLSTATLVAPELVESLYNSALLSFQAGELEDANRLLTKALDVFPDHPECIALHAKLREQFLAL